jgi:hypothetical protein
MRDNILCAEYFDRDGNREKRLHEYMVFRYINGYVRNALGYPLTEALFQQAGITSEGLDVTTSPRIALFFACFDWNGSGYVRKHTGEPSVIYRWEIDESKVKTIEDICRLSFYSIPQLIPTKSILESMGTCETIEECIQSIEVYAKAINWGPCFDLDEIHKERPLHLLRFPKTYLQASRVVKQHAQLLFPDMVLTKEWQNDWSVEKAKNSIISNNSLPLMEDMAENPKCTKYCFIPDYDFLKAKYGLTEESGQEIFPAQDITQYLIKGWIKRFIRLSALALPLEIGPTPFNMHISDLMKEIDDNNERIRWFW